MTLLLTGYSCVCCDSPLFVSPLFTDYPVFKSPNAVWPTVKFQRTNCVAQGSVEWAGVARSVERLAAVWGLNPGGGRDFPQPHRPALGSVQWVAGLFLGDKAAGAWSGPPTSI